MHRVHYTHAPLFQAVHARTSSTDASQRVMQTSTTFLISAQHARAKQTPFRKDAKASQADMLLVREGVFLKALMWMGGRGVLYARSDGFFAPAYGYMLVW